MKGSKLTNRLTQPAPAFLAPRHRPGCAATAAECGFRRVLARCGPRLALSLPETCEASAGAQPVFLRRAVGPLNQKVKWVWVKIKPPGDRRFWSRFPFTRVPFEVPIFDPHPNEGRKADLGLKHQSPLTVVGLDGHCGVTKPGVCLRLA